MATKELATTQQTGIKGLSNFLNQDAIKNKFTEIIGQKANGFIASLLSVVNSNTLLANADQNSIYTAALMAASLDLPINQNLGLAYIVPYAGKAQFQLGYKGFKQLALRSGQFLSLNDSDVRDGEIKHFNRLSGEIEFNWNQDASDRLSKKIIGYVSYFKLVNGFESTLYLTVEEIEVHAKKYSQTYKKYGTGLWKDEFEGMARKTVTKLNLSKNAPLSIELQRATVADQAVIKNFDPSNDNNPIDVDYVDNMPETIDVEQISEDKQYQRVTDHINNSKTTAQLKQVENHLVDGIHEELYQAKLKELKGK